MAYLTNADILCAQWTNESSMKLIQHVETLVQELVANFTSNVITNENAYTLFCKIFSMKNNFTYNELNKISHLCSRYLKEFLCSFLNVKSSAVDKINQTMFFKSIELSLEIVLQVGDDKFCKEFIQTVVLELNSDLGCYQKKHKVLLAINCFLNAMMSVKEDNEVLDIKETYNLLKTDCIHNSLAENVLNSENEAVSNFILSKIGPKLVKVSQMQTFMETLWDNTGKSTTLDLNKKVFIIIGLMNFFLTDTLSCHSILKELTSWNMIQEGLTSNDSKLRKYGLYLLKRLVEHIEVSNLDLDIENFQWTPLKSKTLKCSWENVFIILEILEEKQAHLVIPVVQSTLRAIENSKEIHYTWILSIYIRILSHDSLQVVKQGIFSFLNLNIECYLDYPLFKTTLEILLQKLNNMLLFTCPSGNVEWPILNKPLNAWFSSIQNLNSKNRTACFHKVIDAMAKVQWCTIPLFHILHNMRLVVSEVDIYNENKLDILCEFLREVTRTQNVFVRGAVQVEVLYFLSKLRLQNQRFSVVTVANTISVFRKHECLQRDLESWETLVDWVKHIELEQSEDLLKALLDDGNKIAPEAKARSLVLFVDAGLIELNSHFRIEVANMLSSLKGIRSRSYASRDECDQCLEVIFHILVESGRLDDILFEFIAPFIGEVIDYIDKRLDEVNLEHFKKIEYYVKCLSFLSENHLIPGVKFVEMFKVAEKTVSSPDTNAAQKYYAMNIIFIFFQSLVSDNERLYLDKYAKSFCLCLVDENFLLGKLCKGNQNIELTRNHQVNWGCLVSGYINAVWNTLLICIHAECVTISELLSSISQEDFVTIATNAIESGGREALATVLNVMKAIFSHSKLEPVLCRRFFQYSLESTFELRKVSSFWPSIKAWVGMVFTKQSIQEPELQEIIIKFAEQLLLQGETINGLANALISHLRQEVTQVSTLRPLLKLVTSALFFGPVPRRDQRIENDTCALIRSLGSNYPVNILIPDSDERSSCQVRLSALATLLQVAKQKGGEQLTVEVVNQLIATDNQLTAKRQRYHNDSLHHRVKHRILQALLVLEGVLAESTSLVSQSCIVELLKWSSGCLQGESQQPSVRYQLEWLLVRCLIHSPQLLDSFWTIFSEASEERTGSICSFISIAYHLAISLRKGSFIERCVTEILPWCMAQHFNVRLYAQVVLQKLWPLDDAVAQKFDVIRSSLSRSLNQGNAVRNADKLKNDFYFTSFHPVNHYSFQTIFWELPRLSNITRDEWVPVSSLAVTLEGIYGKIPLLNPVNALEHFSAASWVVKATTEAEPADIEACGMQKKFVPWKNMFPDFEESAEPTPRTELIVVASLIDKMPNLGGLARTCEIFTAQSLVVPSLEYTQDKLFSTLSMSAEKHINIIEVKPHDLDKFLSDKKSSGYTLVGAEQTASSVSLQNFKFPNKCLLLLGNEKEGVPVNLLPLLDVCVEVPQLGVVRSLNVHVTGAIFIWEYTKQYIADKSS